MANSVFIWPGLFSASGNDVAFPGAVTAESLTVTGTVTAGATSALAFNGRAISQSPANGQWNITNNAATAGVGLDVATDGTLKIRNRAQNADAAITASSITSASPTAGIGYATGAGGTVTQATSKSTAVTLNAVTGKITTDAASLAAGTNVSFVFNNTSIAATDAVLITHISGGSGGIYTVHVTGESANARNVQIRNNSAGAEAAALVLQFVVIKAVTS